MSKLNSKFIKIALIVFFFFVGSLYTRPLTAATLVPQSPAGYLRIFYYRDNQAARDSFFQNYKKIDVLAPQAYSFDKNGILYGNIDPSILNFAYAHGIKIMPLVTNKDFAKAPWQKILDDPNLQKSTANQLVGEAKARGYLGWQVDFEGMDASYKDKFSAFIKTLSDTLRENGLVSSVAVIAQVSDNPNDYLPHTLWQKVIGVYDYRALGASADFLSIMSYDDPTSFGPVSSYPWLLKVLSWSMKNVDSSKLSLGIPLYYWRWNTNNGVIVAVGTYKQMQGLLKKHKVKFGYDTEQKEAYFSYTYKGVPYQVWYENNASLKEKLALIKDYKLQGFSAWALGQEIPDFWK